MTQIYYSQFTAPFSKKRWEDYFQLIPVDIQQRIHRYRKSENKYQLLIGRLLLKHGMQQLGFSDFQLSDIYYDENKYPLWKEEVQFNIAHSGNIVACAFSKDKKIGIDVEQIRPINLNDFDYILNKLDQENIAKANNQYEAFFKIWTIKEAVTKAIGLGLLIDVRAIFIFDEYAVLENQKWYYQKLDFEEGFAAHLIGEEDKFEELQIHKMTF